MKKIILLLIFIIPTIFITSVKAQIYPPNYEAIFNEITNMNSKYYYPPLLNRYLNNDTTISRAEYGFLYYGYSFYKNYNPYGASVYLDSLQFYFVKANPQIKDFQKIVSFSELILAENPFHIGTLNTIAFAYNKLGNKVMSDKYADKAKKIVLAILASGDGLSEETAWHIINMSDEPDILAAVSLNFGGNIKLTESGCDYITVGANEINLAGVYFDVKRILIFKQSQMEE